MAEINLRCNGPDMPPYNYTKLPAGIKCRCLHLWKEVDGSYWCCNPEWIEEVEHDRHESEQRALAATNGWEE